MSEKEVETCCPASPRQWREWLQENHDKKQSVWLIYYKKHTGVPSLTWSEAVDEALCFGWIDSQARPLDPDRYMQCFTPRKITSGWSGVNKDKVQRLTQAGRMTEAGLRAVAVAQQNGTWTLLDEVEALVIPPDLEAALLQQPAAHQYFLALSKSDKKALLQWLVLAKRPTTRQRRLTELVQLAAEGRKAGSLRSRP